MLRIKRMLLLVLLILSLLSPLAHADPPTFGVDEIVEAIKLEVMGAQAIELQSICYSHNCHSHVRCGIVSHRILMRA